ncbi:MAG: hypothetical protein ACLPOA_22175 [Methylocella sp.]
MERALLPGRRSAAENRAALAEVARQLSRRSRAARELAERFDDPVIRAAVLCFLVLDTQLTFYRQSD